MEERRQHPRFRCKLRTGVRFPDGHTELLWAEDISHRGMSIHTDKPQRIGVLLRVLAFMFSTELKKEVQAELIVRVVSCVLDSKTGDFRLGLQVEEFIGEAENHIQAQVNHLSEPLPTQQNKKIGHHPIMTATSTFPLYRRIKLALANGSSLTGWTEDVTPRHMRIALSAKLDDHSVHDLNIPVVLAGEPEIFSVHAKARVDAVVFRPMGAFATHFSVFDYQDNGLTLLRRELTERFPEIAQETTVLSDNPKKPKEDDTEALPFLGDLGSYN